MAREFEVWCPDYDEKQKDAVKLSALHHYDAAQKWAEWSDYDSGEYRIVEGEEVIVMVRDLDNRSLFALRVSGEPMPHYSAVDADYSVKEIAK